LPIKGPTHEEAVTLLKNTSIKKKCDDARASDLAEAIRKGLLEQIKWHYSRARDDMPSIGTTHHSERRTRKRKQRSAHTPPLQQTQRHPPAQQPNNTRTRTHTNTYWPGTEAEHIQDASAMDMLSTVAGKMEFAPVCFLIEILADRRSSPAVESTGVESTISSRNRHDCTCRYRSGQHDESRFR